MGGPPVFWGPPPNWGPPKQGAPAECEAPCFGGLGGLGAPLLGAPAEYGAPNTRGPPRSGGPPVPSLGAPRGGEVPLSLYWAAQGAPKTGPESQPLLPPKQISQTK